MLEQQIRTIGHELLDLEEIVGADSSDYQLLDTLISEAESRLAKESYTRNEAINVLETIANILSDRFSLGNYRAPFNQGLKTRQINRGYASLIYLSIAESLGIPLDGLLVGSALFVRWHFDEENHLNWDTLNRQAVSDTGLRSIFKGSRKTDEPHYVRSLTRNETLAYGCCGIYLSLDPEKQSDTCIFYLDKAIELDPNEPYYYFLKSGVFALKKIFGEALLNANIAIKLNPRLVEGYVLLGNAYFNMMRESRDVTRRDALRGGIDAYTKAIELLDPDNIDDAYCYVVRGRLFLNARLKEEALSDLNKAIELYEAGRHGSERWQELKKWLRVAHGGRLTAEAINSEGRLDILKYYLNMVRWKLRLY